MTYSELEQLLQQEEKEHRKRMFDIKHRYANENNPVKPGDIVTDHYHSIKVEKIEVSSNYDSITYSMKYTGIEVKKDGTPKKVNRDPVIFQTNIIEINGMPYKYNKKPE